MRRLLPVVLILLMLPAARVEALTVRDIVDLTRAGLGEEILLALIEVDGSVFTVDTATLTMLKREGVSERVIVAMVRSGRMRPPEEPVPPMVDVEQPAPPVVVVEHRDREVPVPVAVPVYIPYVPGFQHQGFHHRGQFIDPRNDGIFLHHEVIRRQHLKPAEPVYWGFGGKLRPDAWKPAEPAKRDR